MNQIPKEIKAKITDETISENPLVSIIVITYNSSKYVLETLESAKAQTYQNIELIVSDDCSTDNTVEICRNWIEQNKQRFVSTELITTPQNTGIPANCNRGVKAAQGEWVKLIAGDDLLEGKCVDSYIKFIKANDNIEILVSKYRSFYVSEFGERIWQKIYPSKKDIKFFNLSAENQYKRYLTNSFNIIPTIFINAKTLLKLKGFDEEFKFLEDFPFLLNSTRLGIKIFFSEEVTVLYRLHYDNIRAEGSKKMYSTKFFDSMFSFKRKYVYPNVPFYKILYWQSEWLRSISYRIIVGRFSNRKTLLTVLIKRVFSLLDIRNNWRKLINKM